MNDIEPETWMLWRNEPGEEQGEEQREYSSEKALT